MARPANPLNKSVTLAAAFKAIPKKSRICLVKALHVSGVRGINVEFGAGRQRHLDSVLPVGVIAQTLRDHRATGADAVIALGTPSRRGRKPGKKAAPGTVKRGPGRPKASKRKVKSVDVTPTVKRGPGRPRKNPVEVAPAATVETPTAAPTA
jgi:hypothetical protein